MERGQLVPDEITIAMLLARLEAPDAVGGAILDGFPRNRPQAEALDAALEARGSRVDLAMYIDVPDEELIRRLSGRWICQQAGHVYHEQSQPAARAGQCDLDGSPLIQRADDRPEHPGPTGRPARRAAHVVDHYRESGILRTIDGLQPIDSVTAAPDDRPTSRPGRPDRWSPASRAPRSSGCARPAGSSARSWTSSPPSSRPASRRRTSTTWPRRTSAGPARSRRSRTIRAPTRAVRSRPACASPSTRRSSTASPASGRSRTGQIVSVDAGAILDGWHGDARPDLLRRRPAGRRSAT